MRPSFTFFNRVASIKKLRPIPFLVVAALILALGTRSVAAGGAATSTTDHEHDDGHGHGAAEGDRAPTAA